jgi:hypothetical protein
MAIKKTLIIVMAIISKGICFPAKNPLYPRYNITQFTGHALPGHPFGWMMDKLYCRWCKLI